MLILASKSPRRKQLLKEDITDDFEIIVSDIDEEKSYIYSPIEAVRDIAYRKGEKIHLGHYDDTVISADTIVVLSSLIIGKPTSKLDAKRILRLLSNKTHQVITAYAIFKKDKMILNHVISEVTFNELNETLIDEYVQSGSPLDKAGAYGVQDNEKFHIIKEIKGSVKNVIGFPSEEIKNDLMKVS